jgi:hypothetical protein
MNPRAQVNTKYTRKAVVTFQAKEHILATSLTVKMLFKRPELFIQMLMVVLHAVGHAIPGKQRVKRIPLKLRYLLYI